MQTWWHYWFVLPVFFCYWGNICLEYFFVISCILCCKFSSDCVCVVSCVARQPAPPVWKIVLQSSPWAVYREKKHCFYSLILFPCPQLLHIFKVKPKVLDPSLFLNVHIESQRFVRFELLPVEVTVHQMTQSELKNIGFKKTCKHSHMLESRNMILDIVSDTHKFTAASLLFYHQVTANTFI